MKEVTQPLSPYVGLAPFSEKDAPFFFGREAEEESITANLRAARLTLLYGPSGVGKSSVLRAGVIHSLNELASREREEYGTPSFAIVYYRSWAADTANFANSPINDPITGLATSLHEAVKQAFQDDSLEAVPVPASCDLRKLFAAWRERFNLEFLLILDQFEEYLLYRAHEEGDGTFASELPKLINTPELPVRVLLSMREDSISKLYKFKSSIPILYDNQLQIEHMGLEAARRAIEQPLIAYNALTPTDATPYEIEPELVKAVLEQICAGQIELGSAGRGVVVGDPSRAHILAPYLQLVMTRIWEHEKAKESHTLRLTTLTALGGAKQIAETHLDSVMDKLPPTEQDAAASFFHYLVTPDGAKIAHTVSSLAAYTKLPEARISPVLEKLSAGTERILNPLTLYVGDAQKPGYEVYHDALAPAILGWRTRYTVKREQELAVQHEKERAAARQKRILFWARTVATILLATVLLVVSIAIRRHMAARTAEVALEAKAQEVEEKAQEIKELDEDLKKDDDVLAEAARYEALVRAIDDLESDNPKIRKEAVSRLEELSKQGVIPKSLKPLILDAAADKDIEVAKAAQKALQVPVNPVAEQNETRLPPRVYLHIQNERQRAKAKEVEDHLEAINCIVPGIEKVENVRLQTNQLRYFRENDRPWAETARTALLKLGIQNIELILIRLDEASARARPKVYELWFTPDALIEQYFPPVQQRRTLDKSN